MNIVNKFTKFNKCKRATTLFMGLANANNPIMGFKNNNHVMGLQNKNPSLCTNII
jgi:hypothetical protein